MITRCLQVQLIDKIENYKTAIVITEDNWKISSKNVLSKLNWQPLNKIRLSETLLFMRKILRDEVPALMSDQFQIFNKGQYNLYV